ncbi:MAG TPA: hypothetical protein VK845_02820 [Gemmatimonadales bacterium]|nr:hypothetical protein [Gemmatimonadales bacterium]
MSDKFEEWDKKLAEVDRVISKLPAKGADPVPAAKQQGSAPAAQRSLAPPARAAGGSLSVWTRVGLTAILAVALTQWPFAMACGVGLYGYLAAVGVVVGSSLWGLVSTWGRRLPKAHILALLSLLTGLTLLALEVLPRLGYARHVLAWTCG